MGVPSIGPRGDQQLLLQRELGFVVERRTVAGHGADGIRQRSEAAQRPLPI
jgi:hypothetical protein